METLSRAEEEIMVALWSCGGPATRRQIAAALPAQRQWADSTLLNFLQRLEGKNFVRVQKEGNRNLYRPLVRRETYCGAVSEGHIRTLYGGDLRGMLAALADTGRLTHTDTVRLLRWLDARLAEHPEYEEE